MTRSRGRSTASGTSANRKSRSSASAPSSRSGLPIPRKRRRCERRSRALRETMGSADRIRVAKWTVARGYRALGRLDDAEAIQKALVVEFDAVGEPDGYVYEELAEIALARGNVDAARPWAAKAHAA